MNARRLAREYSRARAFAGAIAAYLQVRRRLRTEYDARGLDQLLESLSSGHRSPPVLSVGEVGLAIRLAEPVAARLGSEPNTCLFRALSRFAVLHRAGASPTFVLGAAPDLDAPGHAWVELGDVPFLERSTPRFVRTFSYPKRR